jgi:hypothetical protein
VVVTDHLAVNAQFVSASSSHGSCQTPPLGGTGAVSCDLGFLPRGAAAEIKVKVTVPRRSSVSNTATVTSATPDPDVADNTATVTTTVR